MLTGHFADRNVPLAGVLLALTVALAGCGKKDEPVAPVGATAPAAGGGSKAGEPKGKEEKEKVEPIVGKKGDLDKKLPALDASDISRTTKWLATEYNKSKDFPAGNDLIAKEKREAFEKAMAGLVGREVAWQFAIVRVTPNGEVVLDGHRENYAGNGPERAYAIVVAAPTVPSKDTAWLKTLKAGDRVKVTAKVAKLSRPSEQPEAVSWIASFENASVGP